jgi:hypothetical protein
LAAHVDALAKVGVEEPLLHSMLQFDATHLECVTNEAVCVECVGSLGNVHSKRDAFTRSHVRNVGDDLSRFFRATKFLRVANGNGHRLFWSAWVQLVRTPHHLELLRVLGCNHGERFFETRFANRAPGADNVGVDLDQHVSERTTSATALLAVDVRLPRLHLQYHRATQHPGIESITSTIPIVRNPLGND